MTKITDKKSIILHIIIIITIIINGDPVNWAGKLGQKLAEEKSPVSSISVLKELLLNEVLNEVLRQFGK